jgi:glycosyltransferase involved in cell wall biosynthesis
MNVAVIFDNFGPYHLARLEAAAPVTELLAVEVAASSAEYAWNREAQSAKRKAQSAEGRAARSMLHAPCSTRREWQSVTLLERGTSREVSSGELAGRLNRVLDDFRPQAVFVPGWSGKAAFAALSWCVRNHVPAVAMSESTERDEPRSAWREAVKRRIVGLYSAALVGGRPHKDYMVKLGMPAERIFLGYDAVDNGYFADKAAEDRSQKSEVRTYSTSSGLRPPSPRSGEGSLPENYFLASARFIEKKNLPRLLQAYALYREKAESRKQKAGSGERGAGSGNENAENLKPEMLESENEKTEDRRQKTEVRPPASDFWQLVLLGDGPLKSDLCRLISELELQHCVHLPGFQQYPDLPAYYAHASVFIHASTTEQWGLVVNEAMASSLPVLVSNHCGCAADLVQEGVNGFTFDPYSVEQLAQLMLRAWSMEQAKREELGAKSREIISNWGPGRFANGLKAAAECALRVGPAKPTLLQRMILRALLWK